jgi:hypothetical protein
MTALSSSAVIAGSPLITPTSPCAVSLAALAPDQIRRGCRARCGNFPRVPRHTLRVSFDQDDEDAVGVYRLVANQGHSAAWFNSGQRYENDTGVDHDKLKKIVEAGQWCSGSRWWGDYAALESATRPPF